MAALFPNKKTRSASAATRVRQAEQGCQIFLGAAYQNGKKYTKMITKYSKFP
jgi:hypothetical protein